MVFDETILNRTRQALGEILTLRFERALVAMEAEGRMIAGPTQVPVDPCLEALHMALAMESCASQTSEIPRHTTADAHPKKGGFGLSA